MKRTIVLLAVTLALVAATSSSAAEPPAYTETQHLTFPVEATFETMCMGEEALFVGELDEIVHLTIDPTGHLHVAFATHLNIVGTGLVTGTTFRYVQAEAGPQSGDFFGDGSPTESTFTHTSRMISQGSGQDLFFHMTLHVTVNANGELTADVLQTDLGCRP